MFRLLLNSLYQDKTFKIMKKELQVHERLLFIMRVTFLHFILILALATIANATELSAQVLEKRISMRIKKATIRQALDRRP